MLELNIKNISVADRVWLIHKLGFDPLTNGLYPIDLKIKGKVCGELWLK